MGIHPTRTGEVEGHVQGAGAYISALEAVARRGKQAGKVVAIGECGLDYDRWALAWHSFMRVTGSVAGCITGATFLLRSAEASRHSGALATSGGRFNLPHLFVHTT